VASSLDIGSGTSVVAASVNLTGLSANTAYSCAITATNSGGTSCPRGRISTCTWPREAASPGTTSSASATSTTPTGTASATDAGVTVTATGVGAFTIAQYSSAPGSAPHAFKLSSGSYFDLHVAAGSGFTSLTIVDSNLSGARTLYWYNGSSWVKISPQSYSSAPPPTITVHLSSTSTPTIAQLTGTLFTVAFPKHSLAAALARCHKFHNKQRRASCVNAAKKRFSRH
jgi:hypothetical protein